MPETVVARWLGDDMVVVNLANDTIYELSRTAARLWELLADGQDREAACAQLAQEFSGVSRAELDREVDATVSMMIEEGLLRVG